MLCLQIPLTYSDPGSLVTTAPISCSDQRCSWGVQYSNSRFSVQNNLYAYMSRYRDGNGISGFCVSDVLPFDIRLIPMTLGYTCCLILYLLLSFFSVFFLHENSSFLLMSPTHQAQRNVFNIYVVLWVPHCFKGTHLRLHVYLYHL